MSDSRSPAREEAIGRYRLLCKLGGDEIGFYWLARPSEAGPIDAPKIVFIPRTILLSSALQRSFWEGELHTARRASHPALLEAHELVWDEGRLGLVYDYAERISLRRLLELSRGKPLPERAVLRIVLDVAAALHSAHETRDDRADLLHVVHGGVRPESVFVRADGLSMLGHLGVHRAWRSAVAAQGGTPRSSPYDAPEVADGAPATRRSDVYSAGVLLLELGLGALPKEVRAPRPGSSAEDRAEAVVRAVSALPEGLSRVVEHCVRPDPGRRFQTALALERALLDVAPIIQHEGLDVVRELVEPALKKERLDLQLRLTSEQHEPPTTELRRALSRIAPKGESAPPSIASDPHMARTREREAYDPDLADEVSTKVYAEGDARAFDASARSEGKPLAVGEAQQPASLGAPALDHVAPSEPPTRARLAPGSPFATGPDAPHLADEISERIAALVDDDVAPPDAPPTTARFRARGEAGAAAAPPVLRSAEWPSEVAEPLSTRSEPIASPRLRDSDPDDGELAEARAFAVESAEVTRAREQDEAHSIDELLASAPPGPLPAEHAPPPRAAAQPSGELEAFMRAQMGALLEASRLSAPPPPAAPKLASPGHALELGPAPFPSAPSPSQLRAAPKPLVHPGPLPHPEPPPLAEHPVGHATVPRVAAARHTAPRPPPAASVAPPADAASVAPPPPGHAFPVAADPVPTAKTPRRRPRRLVPYLVVLAVALAAGALAILGLYDPELRRSPRQAPVVDAHVDFDAALHALAEASVPELASTGGDQGATDASADEGGAPTDGGAADRADGGEPPHDAGHGAKPRGPGAPRPKAPRRH